MNRPDSFNRHAAAALLGIHWNAVNRLTRYRWLVMRQGRIAWADLRASVQDRRLWIMVPPEQIADPLLRAYALDARRRLGGGRWWSAGDLARHYHVSPSTVEGWRERHRWPGDGAWERCGAALFWWGHTPPPPAEDRRIGRTPVIAAQFHRDAAVARAAVVAAVLAAGGPPGRRGSQAFWPKIGAMVGCLPVTARWRWRYARHYGELPIKEEAS